MSASPPIRAVLFDFWDTLARRDGGRISAGRRRIAQAAGVDPEPVLALWDETLPDRTVGALGTLEDEIAAMLVALETEPEAALIDRLAEIERQSWIEALTLYPDTLRTLQALRDRGFALGLVSNCSNQTAAVLWAHHLAQHFDAVALSFEVGAAKPDARIFLHAVERLGTVPSACAFVADGADGELEAAHRLGMFTVWMQDERLKRRSEAPEVCDFRITRVSQLLDLLELPLAERPRT